MDPWFLQLLDKLRDYCGFPIMLNSAYRSVEYEKQHGRSGNSMHCKGRAVDIHCTDPYKRHALVKYAVILGFPGIGIYPTFVHLDNRSVATCWYGTKEGTTK